MQRMKLHDGTFMELTTPFEYHRNGVAGDGFYTVKFRYADEEFVAVLASASFYDDSVKTERSHVYTYVVNPDNLAETMRGHDFFGPALVRALNAWTKREHTARYGEKAKEYDLYRHGSI